MVSFSVIIISQGREELLLKCLDSLRPVTDQWQLILVANGEPLSEEVQRKAQTLTHDVDVITLERRVTPGKARNMALEAVRNEWIFFIDDDAYVLPKYFETALPLLSHDRIDVFGGPDAPAKGMDDFSQALAITLSSPFCTGKTYIRHRGIGKDLTSATEEKLTSCNLWLRRSVLSDLRFPEEYLRTEETALLLDLEKNGARMFYHPRLVVAHHRRKSVKDLWRPTFYAGFYRSKVMRDKRTGNLIYWLPSLFVLLHLTLFMDPVSFGVLARIYGGIILMMSLNLAARKKRMRLFPYVAFLHYFIVFNYGLGFLAQRLGWHGNK